MHDRCRFHQQAAVLLLALLVSCGRGSGGSAGLDIQRDVQGFGLRVLPECLSLDPAAAPASADFTLSIVQAGDETVASISAEQASGLKALYCDIAYDSQRFTPLEAQASGALAGSATSVRLSSGAQPPQAPLELAILSDPGVVHYGELLPGWQLQPGFSGSAVLATVRFRAAHPGDSAAVRTAAQAPASEASRAPIRIYAGNTQLLWWYVSQGDCDENSEVNVANLTPLGNKFGQTGPFAMSSALSCIDSDTNGEVNIADLTPIGANFQRHVEGYRVYSSSSSADYPASPEGPNGAGATLIGDMAFSTSIMTAPPVRRAFSFSIPAPGASDIYWARPYDAGAEGIASRMMAPGVAGNHDPQATLGSTPSSGAAPLSVTFDATGCTDPDGDPMTFRWDLDGDGTLESDTGSTASNSFTYNSAGDYYPMLQVSDGLGGFDAVFTHISVTGGGANIPPNITSMTCTPNPISSGGVGLVHIVFADPDNAGYSGSCTPDLGGTALAPPSGLPLSLDFYYTAPVVAADATATLTCVIDDGTDTDTDSFAVNVIAPVAGNSAPVVSAFGITPDPLPGGDTGGLSIAASDPDGDPMTVTWVHNGNNGNISGSGFSVNYASYTVAAIANVTVTAHIDDGHGNVTVQPVSFQVVPAANDPPTVSIGASANAGPRPLTVDFTATASDPDGDALTYNWDYNDDGTVDYSTSAFNTANNIYLFGGSYTARVTVDDGHGHTATDTMSIGVTPTWTHTIMDPAVDSGLVSSLVDHGGIPGIAYYYFDGLSTFQTQYFEAADPFGNGWSGGPVGPGGGEGVAAVFSGGVIGVGVYSTAVSAPCTFYRYLSPGVVSPATVSLVPGEGLHMLGADINGQPALCWCHMIDASNYELRYARATDASSDTWGAALTVDISPGYKLGWRCSLAVVDGNPAIAYTDNTSNEALFIRATDPAGAVWGGFHVVAIPPGSEDFSGNCRLVVVAGSPAVFYVDQNNNALYYKRADDADGTTWTGADMNIANNCSTDIDAVTYASGLPACAFVASDTGALRYIELNDANGTSTSGSLDIDASTSCAAPSFREIGGYPAASYYDVTGHVLKYAVRY